MTTKSCSRPIRIVAGLALLLAARSASAACPITGYSDGGGSNLKIVGTTGKQTVSIALGATTTVLSLDCNGDGDFLDSSLGDVNAADQGTQGGIDLQLGGADTITVNVSESFTTVSKAVKLVLGPGTNVVNIGSTGSFFLSTDSRLLVDIAGGAGIDKPTLDFSNLNCFTSAISVRADLGAGSDVATIKAPLANSGAIFSVDVALGLGTNSLSYTDAGAGTGSTRRVDIQGDAGVDSVTMNFGSSGDARSLYTVDLGAGNDKLLVNFNLAAFSLLGNARFHMTANGGLGNDTISVGRNGTTAGAASVAGLLELDLNGGPGNDPLTVDFGGGGFSMLNGTERLRLDGGAGSDVVKVTLDSTTASTAVHDISISGGSLADKIAFVQNTAGAGTHTWFGGAALVDGSFGTPDLCTLGGSAAANARRRNCELPLPPS